MPCQHKWEQISNTSSALGRLSVSPYMRALPGFGELYALRGSIMSQVMGPFPRVATLFRFIPFLSPGQVRIWFDTEVGWIVEGRASPGAPPVLRSIDQETAMQLLDPEAPEELLHPYELPDPYIGE